MASPDLAVARERIAAELAAPTGQLDLSGLEISELPPELEELTSLRSLDCSDTQVSDLEPLRGLPSLQTLYCRGTQVSDLEPLRDLNSLQTLSCWNTQVSDLEPLRGLHSLQSLNCSDTQVSDLEPLRGLPSLQTLDCSYTQVSDLEPLRGLPSLQTLDCSGTQVSDLKPLVDLQNLRSLECRNLKLGECPRKLLFSENLQSFYLYGASIRGIPGEAFSLGSSNFDSFSYNSLPSLRAHVLDLEEEAIPIKSVKILVLGNGGVGKTQLCRHLTGEPFDPAVPST
ncbi:MAG: leucine-rich repeat domain-containing protein, partial [Cyanobacteriota bacterium]